MLLMWFLSAFSTDSAFNSKSLRFFFFESISFAVSSKYGATTHSINIFSISFAAASSTGQLIAIIPPNALTLSPSNALLRAEDEESPIATPQGFVCLITTAAF